MQHMYRNTHTNGILINTRFLSLTLSIYLSIYLSVYPSIYLFIYLSIYLFIYLTTPPLSGGKKRTKKKKRLIQTQTDKIRNLIKNNKFVLPANEGRQNTAKNTFSLRPGQGSKESVLDFREAKVKLKSSKCYDTVMMLC